MVETAQRDGVSVAARARAPSRGLRAVFLCDPEERGVMKKLVFLSLAMAAAIPVAGCETPQQQNAANGALIGGVTGALIGGAANRAGGALAGGAIGAATGAIIGSAATPPGPGYYPPPPPPGYAPPPLPPPPAARCAEWYYDYYGNRVCRGYY